MFYTIKDTLAQNRFEKKFKKDSTNKCWLWFAGCGSDGYGCFRLYGKIIGSHRVAFALYKGSIPNGKVVRHTCDNPKCVNPKHLILGTQLDNINDRHRKGRDQRGASHSRAKLDELSVRLIRDSKLHYTTLAAIYGVSGASIRGIQKRRTWAYLK